MRNALTLLAAAALLAAVSAQAGDIYRWKDGNGLWHYADQPVPGAERVASTSRGLATRPEGAATPPAPRPTPAPSTPVPGNNPTVQKVHEDVATAKAAKCKEAQDSYDQTINARRLARQGPNGEQVFLTDEEIDAARVAARSTMEYYCGK